MKNSNRFDTRKLVLLALLTAIVVVLQILAIVTRPLLPLFSISLVLMPITVGAALIGVSAGGWLGLAFGLAVLISGDALPFMTVNAPGAILVVLLKGLLAGLAAGGAYRLFADKSKTIAAIVAAAICPIVNTAIFIAGSYIFFLPTITEWGAALGFISGTAYIFFGMVGVNFLIELGLNLVLIPVIVRLIQYGQDKKVTAS